MDGLSTSFSMKKLVDLCPVSAKDLNYSLLDGLGMLYVFKCCQPVFLAKAEVVECMSVPSNSWELCNA